MANPVTIISEALDKLTRHDDSYLVVFFTTSKMKIYLHAKIMDNDDHFIIRRINNTWPAFNDTLILEKSPLKNLILMGSVVTGIELYSANFTPQGYYQGTEILL
jgi:hypothetical protein